MPLEYIPILSKYAAPALFGAATKTYFDYKRNKVTICKLLLAWIANSFFALGLGVIAAHTFIHEYPANEHFAYPIAYLAGAIGINILSGLTAINWRKAIQSRVDK